MSHAGLLVLIALLAATPACGSDDETSSTGPETFAPSCEEVIEEAREDLEGMETTGVDVGHLNDYNAIRNAASEELNSSGCGGEFFDQLDAVSCDFLTSAKPSDSPSASATLKSIRAALCEES